MLEFYTLVDHIISLTLPVGNHQSSLGVRSSRLVRLVLGLLLFTKKKTSVSLVAVHDVTIRITKQTAGYVLLSSRNAAQRSDWPEEQQGSRHWELAYSVAARQDSRGFTISSYHGNIKASHFPQRGGEFYGFPPPSPRVFG